MIKKTIPKITIRGLLVTFLSEYIRHNRKLSIIFNFRFNMYHKKFEKRDATWSLTPPPPVTNCHTFLDPLPSPRAWRTLRTAPNAFWSSVFLSSIFFLLEYLCAYLHAHMHLHLYIYIHIIYIYVQIHNIYIYIYIYTHTYIHAQDQYPCTEANAKV